MKIFGKEVESFYDVPEGKASLIDYECPVCERNVEAVYVRQTIGVPMYGPGSRTEWVRSKFRCPKCRIVFDLEYGDVDD